MSERDGIAAVDIAVVGPDPLWVVDHMNRLHHELPDSVVRDYVTVLEAIDDLEPGHPAVLLLAPELTPTAAPIAEGLRSERPELGLVGTIAPGAVEPEIVKHIRMATEAATGYPAPDADDRDAVVAIVRAAQRDRQEAALTTNPPVDEVARYSAFDGDAAPAMAIARGLGSDSRLVTLTSGKGGVGTTTIAINLAAAFVREGGRATVVDAHGSTGDVGLLLGLAPHDHADPADLVDLEINAETIRRFVSTDEATGVSALVLPTGADHLTSLGVTFLIDVLLALDGSADLVVVDAPADLVFAAQLRTYSERVVVVTSAELAAIKDTKVVVSALAEGHGERLVAVLNHPTDRKLRADGSDIAPAIGVPVVAELPYDDHLGDGERPTAVAPDRSGFAHRVRDLLHVLAVRP